MHHVISQYFEKWKKGRQNKKTLSTIKTMKPTDITSADFLKYLHEYVTLLCELPFTNYSLKKAYRVNVESSVTNFGSHIFALSETLSHIKIGGSLSGYIHIQQTAKQKTVAGEFLVSREEFAIKPHTACQQLNEVLWKMKGHLESITSDAEREHYYRNLTYILSDTESIVEALDKLANL